METPKELQKYYYKLLFETLSVQERADKIKENWAIFGYTTKPARTPEQQEFFDYINPLFNKTTTLSRILNDLNIVRSKKENRSDEELIIAQFPSLEEAQVFVRKYQAETDSCMDALFARESDKLNEIYSRIS